MKKLGLTIGFLFCLLGMTNLSAQTKQCTPEQMAACKKICTTADASKCTPAQKAACQQVCAKKGTATAQATGKGEGQAQLVNNKTTSTEKKTCAKSTAKSKSCCKSKAKQTSGEAKLTMNASPSEAKNE